MAAAVVPDYLLIDISNSFTKLIPATREALLGESSRIPTPRLTAAALRHAVGKETFRKGVILSSVVPDAEAAVEAFAASLRAEAGHKPPRLLKVNHKIKLGVAVDYPKPASIGADRLANAAGAAALYGAPAIVIDFGTAVTFDVLAAPRRIPTYAGGVIAPGLEAMIDYLYQRTALLPRIDLREPVKAIGKSTIDAMLAGAVYGYRGLVRQILEEIRREMKIGRRLHTIATGGYAELIAERLPEVQQVHPNLTLEGLRIIGNLNLP
ncbi:MAG: type III pantothenate kinase [Chthoniobacteraceae bacterium]|nr:type III pantothenate kinase [Chthoniobacteraceae bacterium]